MSKEFMGARDDAINVAAAYGPGAGQFVAAALADALGSGVPLVAVRDARDKPLAGKRGIEFVFAHAESEFEEIIRVGLEHDGQVVSAQIVRGRPKWYPASHPAESELRAAIRSGDSVSTLGWQRTSDPERTNVLAITMRSDHQFAIPMDGPEGQNASRVARSESQSATQTWPKPVTRR